MPFRRVVSCSVAVALTAAAFAALADSTQVPVLQIYSLEGEAVKPNTLFLGTPANWASVVPKQGKGPANAGSVNVEPTQIDGKNGLKVTWTGGIGQIYSQSKTASDQMDILEAGGALVFNAVVHEPPEDQVQMRVDCRYPCMGIFDATALYKSAPLNKPMEVKIPLSCFETGGARFSSVNTPFLIFTSKKFSLSVSDIRWVPGAAKDPNAVKC